MARNVGTITREAPPGPEMDEQQFVDAMNDMADDAARWRYLRQNWAAVTERYPLERLTGFELQYCVDEDRK